MESTARFEQGYDDLIKQYIKKAQGVENDIGIISRKITQTGWVRVFIFILLFTVPFYIYTTSIIASIFLFIGFAICFGVLIKRFNKYKRLKSELQALLSLNINEKKAHEGDWSCFDSGKEYIDPQHNYSHDLDLFGKGSFFQYINRTSTLDGSIFLKDKIQSPLLDHNDILREQEALKELSQILDFRQLFFAKGKLLQETEEDLKKIKAFSKYKPFIKSKSLAFQWSIKIMPLLFFVTLVLSFFGLSASIPSLIFFFNLSFIGANLKLLNRINNQFSSLSGILQKYAVLIDTINQEKFISAKLDGLQKKLNVDSKNVHVLINKLSKHMGQFDQRNGMLAGVILNGIFLWDYACVKKIEDWFQAYGKEINTWLDVVHEIDALCSMAGFVYNHPDFVFPTLSNNVILDAKDLGHPLINRSERICNSYDFKDSIFSLITGANMSGKSTFLRTVGLNLILARCGMAVCAKQMIFKPMSLITNMRTTDSLMKHESYFYAELKRLKYIIEQLKKGNDIFIILDEILKGTNSKDKTYGSMELIKHLLSLNAYGMIATHDLELGVLENETGGKIINRCFEVENVGNTLKFDYKLHFGVTQNHNATFLMKQMGIILT